MDVLNEYVLAIAALAFFVLLVLLIRKSRGTEQGAEESGRRDSSLQERIERQLKTIDKLKQRNEQLSKTVDEQSIKIEQFKQNKVQLHDTIAEQRGALQNQVPSNELENARIEAQRILSEAKAEAQVNAQEDRDKARVVRQEAEAQLQDALRQVEVILADARQQASQVAGDAIEAKEKADLYSAAIRAARNEIRGYGDEYVMPNQSVLDDLADEFGHKEAGQKLKQQRAYIKTVIREQSGADCDYVEANRKETAVRFVLDAFNGKVDSILTKVKHDNYGTLKQQIQDAYALVNLNGSAFRNARITPTLLSARQAELKWAIAARELQLKEREEQRAIKEQIREEERARREYEKARKEAEKEERMLQKAMVQARKHLEQSTEEERQRYQLELEELQVKLADAESKNERALSMAQQTRAGHVYVISNLGSFGEEIFKVGMTRRLEPMDRVKELGDASVPFEFDVHAMIYSDDAPSLEKELHRQFEASRVNKVNARKEFFNLDLATIRSTIEVQGVEAHFTMVAEAREYRESLAIAKEQSAEMAVPA